MSGKKKTEKKEVPVGTVEGNNTPKGEKDITDFLSEIFGKNAGVIPDSVTAFNEMFKQVFGGGGCGCGCGDPQQADRPALTTLTTIEINIDDLWKRASAACFEGLQTREYPVASEKLLGLMAPFGGPNLMREAMRDQLFCAVILSREQYDHIADMVNHKDPFVIVIRKGNDVWAVVNPLEDVH